MSERIMVLPYHGEIGSETRPLFFYQSFGLEVPACRVISFGKCNFNCPYCKRKGSFRTEKGSIVNSVPVQFEKLVSISEDAVQRKQIVRLSGGDPVTFPQTSLDLARKVVEAGGKASLAHNGSSPAFISRMAEYVESAAIDLKAPPAYLSSIIGLSPEVSTHMYRRSLESQRILLETGVMVDVRTPVFNFTTLDDLFSIAADLEVLSDKGKLFWTLRSYSEVSSCNFRCPESTNLMWFGKEIKQAYPSLRMGIRAKWESGGFVYL